MRSSQAGCRATTTSHNPSANAARWNTLHSARSGGALAANCPSDDTSHAASAPAAA